MWIKEPGWITDRILFLGRKESCVYLTGQDEHTIIGGGLAYIVPELLTQLDRYGIDRDRITRLLILHAHFDHVGVVSHLQNTFPNLRVIGSPRAKELLSRDDVANTIIDMNRGMFAANGMETEARDVILEPIRMDETVTGGDLVTWGGVDFEIIDAPGHSSCSIAAYMPEEKALFASDAGGIPFGDMIFAAGNSNFTEYQQTLKRFSAYDVDIHLAEHYGAFTDEEGRTFMGRSIQSAKETRKILEDAYRKTGNIAESTGLVTEAFTAGSEGYFLPRPVMEMVIGQMMRHIAKTMDASG
ncbi:MAG: MBL fold metallo-hydrolase [Deltaproteobacteria bacterium]|nr:MBL fold metallo-hydrolase [Candidatus Zymogenaceae bacterium]